MKTAITQYGFIVSGKCLKKKKNASIFKVVGFKEHGIDTVDLCEMSVISTKLHGITYQKTATFFITSWELTI